MIWLASWPRSGNTFLRTILWNCFAMKSGSVYPNDLGGDRNLARVIGHVELDEIGKGAFRAGDPPILKTHERPKNSDPAIFVIRDGRPACVSLWKFYEKQFPLSVIVEGRHRFDSWANHFKSWNPINRPNTLLLKYEYMVSDINGVIDILAKHLNRQPKTYDLPSRDRVADITGHHVNKQYDWREFLVDSDLDKFWETNGDVMKLTYGKTRQ